jgi:hypothetical protein
VELWDLSRVEIKSEKCCQFLDAERTGNYGDTMQEPSCKFLVCVVDLLQRAFVRPIECLWQFVQGMPDTAWEAFPEVVQLTIHPTEPSREVRVSVMKKGGISALHSIRSFCQDVNYKLPVLLFPSSHRSVRVYDRLDIVLDVLLLSSLLV